MRPTEQKIQVAHVLHLTAIGMMSKSPLKNGVQQQAQRIWERLRLELSAEGMAMLEKRVKTMTTLTQTLVRCENEAMLDLAQSYAEALLQGEVLIVGEMPAMADQELTN